MSTIFIDTLFVVAQISQRDQYHARAEKLAQRYDGNRFLTTDAVLLEIADSLAKNFKAEAAQVVDGFFSSPDVEIVRLTSTLFDDAWSMYKSHADKQWSLTDCISFVAMRRTGVTDALTFDHHFEQAGFRALMRDE